MDNRGHMYICICNAIKSDDVLGAIENGASCAREVFTQHNCSPDCAKCVNCIRTMVKDTKPHEPDVLAAE